MGGRLVTPARPMASKDQSMRSLTGVANPQDTSEDAAWFFMRNLGEQNIHTSVCASSETYTPPPVPVILPQESFEAKATVNESGSGGPGSVVVETSGGLTINLIFDAA